MCLNANLMLSVLSLPTGYNTRPAAGGPEDPDGS